MGNKDSDALATAFSNSKEVCFVFSESTLIAAGRVLADGAYCAIVCDIAVHPDYQGQGIGSQILAGLKEKVADHKRTILFSRAGKEGFYEKHGFVANPNFMVIYK